MYRQADRELCFKSFREQVVPDYHDPLMAVISSQKTLPEKQKNTNKYRLRKKTIHSVAAGSLLLDSE